MSKRRSWTFYLAALAGFVLMAAMAGRVMADSTVPSAGDFVTLGDRLIFATVGGGEDAVLWSTDGTAASTVELTSRICPSPCVDVRPLGTVGGVALLAAHPGGVWRTDGTPAGTFPVTRTLDSTGESAQISPSDGTLFFTACGPILGCELWSSDGSRAGTRVLRDIVPGPNGSYPHSLTSWEGKLYFLAGGETLANTGLWSTDGTTAGTRFIAHSVNNFVNGDTLVAASGRRLFFTSLDVTEQLWTSDGTPPGGTRRLHAFVPPPCTEPDLCGAPYLHFLVPVGANGAVIFLASDGVHGPQFWLSGGVGVVRLTDVPGNLLANASPPQRPGRLWIFSALGSPQGPTVLWKADFNFFDVAPVTGCQGGCPEVVAFFPPSIPHSSRPPAPRPVLFVGTDPAHGAELWATDGRGAGTQRLADVCPGACSAFSSNVPPTVLGDATGRTYFLATPRADSDSQALWVTNGAPAGTLRISSFARGVGFLNGLVYFSAAAPDGLELRATDGKSGASHLVTVLQP
ncbi:MAG TPA: hypothetical protein VGG20_06485 [Thermoanaerobaculia bacterium]|jgi:ELWxxDGT repeat protein